MTREMREIIEAAFVEWATEQMEIRGDLFATEHDLENIKSDPLAFDSMLQGEDAYEFLRRIFQIADRREREREEAENAAVWRAMSFRTDDGYRLDYADGKWTDGDLEFNDERGWPVDADGEILHGHFEEKTK